MILIRETSSQRRAWRGGDARAYGIVIAQELAARRKLGTMLLAGAPRGEVQVAMAQRCRRLARLSEAEFLIAVESGDEGAGRRAPVPVPRIVMVQTEFRVDERGNLHRQAYAVDAPSAGAG